MRWDEFLHMYLAQRLSALQANTDAFRAVLPEMLADATIRERYLAQGMAPAMAVGEVYMAHLVEAGQIRTQLPGPRRNDDCAGSARGPHHPLPPYQRYAPQLEKRVRAQLRPTNDSWRVNETYIKVRGSWMYLYRAVDAAGPLLEFMLRPFRQAGAAACFFRKALGQAHTVRPRVVNVDRNAAYPPAVAALQAGGTLAVVSG